MFDDDDPLLGEIRRVALAFTDADEKISHGHPAFFTKKVFAYLDASTDFVEVAELIEDSYRMTAGPRRVARLDALRN